MPKPVTDPTDVPHAFEVALNRGDLEQIVALYGRTPSCTSERRHTPAPRAVRDEMQQLLAARANIKNALRLTLNNGTTALITEDSVLRLTAPAEFS